MNDDTALLLEYVRCNSEEAFSALVTKHIDLVYSVALRQVRDPHLAQEVTQVVFIILARKAKMLTPKTILPGWLCRTARYSSAKALTVERRRWAREHEAHQMQSIANEPEPEGWKQISSHLDDALGCLPESDHNAIVLRYFQNRSFVDVASALGTSEAAAKMRVNRAIEKLRKFFTRRGVVLSSGAIGAALSANSVQAAPAGLAALVATTAFNGTVLAASTFTLLQGTLKLIAWTQAKILMSLGAAALVMIGIVTLTTSSLARARPTPTPVALRPTAQVQPAGTLVTPAGPQMGSVNGAAGAVPQPRIQAGLQPGIQTPAGAAIPASPKKTTTAAAPVYPNTPLLSALMARYMQPNGMITMPPGEMLKFQYGNLFQILQLTPAEVDSFMQIQVEKENRTTAAYQQHAIDPAVMRQLNANEARAVIREHLNQMQVYLQPIDHDADTQIELLLASEDKYRYYRLYTDQRKERAIVMGGYRGALNAAGVPALTLEEDEELVSLLYQARIHANNDVEVEAQRAPQIMQDAASFLTADQVRVFEQFLPNLLNPANGALGSVGFAAASGQRK